MRLLILCFSLLTLVTARAQHHHFLYLQTDQQQPFYVKMGPTVLSSSSDGFLIIPRLRDSAVEMVVGFPLKKFPEYRFRFDGFRKDRGMALKDFGEKGWGLFDYQTLEIVMGEKIEEKQAVAPPPPPPPLTSDPFTVVLASVIDDPGLLATPLVQSGSKAVYAQAPVPARNLPPVREAPVQQAVAAKKPSPPMSTAVVPASKDSAVATVETKSSPLLVVPGDSAVVTKATEQPSPTRIVAKDSAVATVETKTSPVPVVPKDTAAVAQILEQPAPPPVATVKSLDPGIRKLSDQERPSGRTLLFLDPAPGRQPDTVDVFIPVTVEAVVTVQKPEEPSIQKTAVESTAIHPADSMARVVEAKPKAPVAAERIITDTPDTAVVSTPKTISGVQPPAVQPDTVAAAPGKPVRSNCVRMASDKDLQALRKRMVGMRDEDDMVSAALKDAKLRCYSTEQVKTLSFVFVRQEGKYKLIDAVYPYVYDPANYGTLEPLLTDKYFIHRFRALVQ